MKILLLDDDVDMCTLMRETFEGFQVKDIAVCNTYQEVVNYGERIIGYDVVFLDVNLGLGQKSGVDVYTWLTEVGYQNRVVFFTGHARSYPLLVDALKNPQVGLLEKPATLAMIKKALYG